MYTYRGFKQVVSKQRPNEDLRDPHNISESINLKVAC